MGVRNHEEACGIVKHDRPHFFAAEAIVASPRGAIGVRFGPSVFVAGVHASASVPTSKSRT